jgi:hypothetical protein
MRRAARARRHLAPCRRQEQDGDSPGGLQDDRFRRDIPRPLGPSIIYHVGVVASRFIPSIRNRFSQISLGFRGIISQLPFRFR